MDSFFTFLLRNYFSDIDLDPGFRQIDPTESKIIAGEVLRDFLEEKYAEKDPAFLHCASYFCLGADDLPLEELILELCDKAGSHPCAEAWLKELSIMMCRMKMSFFPGSGCAPWFCVSRIFFWRQGTPMKP